MFKKNFINFCNKKGIAPTVVCQEIGLSTAVYSKWTDESVPRKTTLIKLADYFGITVEELLSDDPTPAEIKKEPTGPADELSDDIKLISALVGRLSSEQLPPVLSIAANIGKLSPDQLSLVADVIKNMVK